jgi:hypothetical protein
MKIKFIAPASDFASTKYTPSQRPLHHFCCECARAQHYDSLTGWTLCARPLARQMQLLRKCTLLLFRGICSTMKLWSIFHVYSTVTSTDVRYWILALPMRDIRATDIDLL